MLDQMILNYIRKFQAANAERRYGDTLKISEEMKSEFKANPPEATEVVRYLDAMAIGRPLPGSDLVFTAVWCNPSDVFLLPLCRILESEPARDFHEPAVELLGEIADSRAIPALEKAINYRWDYDEWLSIPRKALQALHSIGTPEAILIIHRALASPETRVREEARALLEDAS